MKVGILGSGFGLYGYLPSLLEIEAVSVVLPRRYASRVMGRDDIRSLASRILWADDERDLLVNCEALVVSQRPEDQAAKLADILGQPRVRALAIEKPIAPTPAQASEMLDRLEAADLRFRVGFTFRYTPWAEALLSFVRGRTSQIESFDLCWKFRAHHHLTGAANWKGAVSCGGGALRFYGIHLVALLAECGYDTVTLSATAGPKADTADVWQASLSGRDLPRCDVTVACDAPETEFALRSGAVGFPPRILADPFEDGVRRPPFDRRVDVVSRLCRDLLEGEHTSCALYRGATDL